MADPVPGELAAQQGYQVVPDSGEEGKVKWGAREINRTRDYVAALKVLIPGNKAAARAAAGLTSSNAVPAPTDGNDGDWHLRTV